MSDAEIPLEFQILKVIDAHLHLRQGKFMKELARQMGDWYDCALIIGNRQDNPVITIEDALEYRQEIREAARCRAFTPVMTVMLTQATTSEIVRTACEQGIRVVKWLPKDVTSHSETGIRNICDAYPTLAAMERLHMILAIHAETKNFFPARNEEAGMIPTLQQIRRDFPGLRLAIQHLSTIDLTQWVWSEPVKLVHGTITAHHLVLIERDWAGDAAKGLKPNPHNFCRPPAKTVRDREAVIQAAVSGDPHFSFGSDSAAWTKVDKEDPTRPRPAGIYSPPEVAIPLVVDIFVTHLSKRRIAFIEAQRRIGNFLSCHTASFHGWHHSGRLMTIRQETWQVPEIYGVQFPVVPLWANRELRWKAIRP